MIDAPALVKDLKAEVLRLEEDLRTRLTDLEDTDAAWRAEHARAVDAERTATSWEAWRDDRITQAAVAWVLTAVFVRFCEDNALLEPVWIAGPSARRQEALDAQLAYFRAHPDDTDREWLRQAVDHLARTPSTRDLVDTHAALRMISPSGQAATRLLDFWRRRNDDGDLQHDFTDPKLSTRFLGDLYQDLSDHAKATYALLQTPVFVEEFILDQTMESALAERPLDGFRLIDPTCGSGHFLLGAFARLLGRWDRRAPGLDRQTQVQIALDAVHGVDVNPFAVAITRFRLTLAALQACGLRSLEDAPGFRYHVAAGDSLLVGTNAPTLPLGRAEGLERLTHLAYATEDLVTLEEILQPGRYDVVVGNPPYITVKDKALNVAYRDLYSACKGTYALSVPFMQRFFELAKTEANGQRAGWVGQITSNSFTKREFGSKIIQDYLPRQDLRLIVDTSGAYIPGHGTPTVIIVGRHTTSPGSPVRAVLGVRGEPGRPADPARAKVWSSIAERVEDVGYVDEWISVVNVAPDRFQRHPWTLSGGAAPSVLSVLNRNSESTLSGAVREIGFGAVTREDAAFKVGLPVLRRRYIETEHRRALIDGDELRDWYLRGDAQALWPYSRATLEPEIDPAALRLLWPLRVTLVDRVAYGKTQLERGLQWFEYSMFFKQRYLVDFSIAYAEISTHNHFVLDRGGKVFKQTAPVIKLPMGASEDDHLQLLGVLNSSVACFWLKQNCYPKGGDPVGDNGARVSQQPWSDRYQFNGSNVADLPLPSEVPLSRSRCLDDVARQLSAAAPGRVVARETPTLLVMKQGRQDYDALRARLVAEQEELDWEVYGLYGLLNACATSSGLVYDDEPPGLELGQRAFEITLARKAAAGEKDTAWFTRHGSTPIMEIPEHWPADYRALVQRRLDLIASDPQIALLEKPEHKRRWASESWEVQEERALRGWLLDRVEDRALWFEQGRPRPRSVSQLADVLGRDKDYVSVLALWEGRPDVPVEASLLRLLKGEAVPFLAAYRLKDSGLRTFQSWQRTWDLQRREDAGERVGTIPVPPKYTSADFRPAVWPHRGKLDVPKERFTAYPDAGRTVDPTPLLGWAGWDHAEQFLALSTIILEREHEGWDDERLVPLVAGLAELEPWVRQWHAELDPTYGVSLADFCTQQVAERCAQIDRSVEQLAAWRPQPPTRGRRPRS